MSYIGKVPINVPKTVKLLCNSGIIKIKGPLGTNFIIIPKGVHLEIRGQQLRIKVLEKKYKENWGTTRKILNELINELGRGYEAHIKFDRIGFRVFLLEGGRQLHIKLGFANEIFWDIPRGIYAFSPDIRNLELFSISRERLNIFIAKIRNLRPPEPYKGTGILVNGEKITLKESTKDKTY